MMTTLAALFVGGDKPTRSLVWYDAYNAVKHHREIEFERGSLRGGRGRNQMIGGSERSSDDEDGTIVGR
jgi:hypothetical protein